MDFSDEQPYIMSNSIFIIGGEESGDGHGALEAAEMVQESIARNADRV